MEYNFTDLTEQLRQLNFAKTNEHKGYKIWFRYNNEPEDKCTHYAIVDTLNKFIYSWITGINERTTEALSWLKPYLLHSSEQFDVLYRITNEKDPVIKKKNIGDTINFNLASCTMGNKDFLNQLANSLFWLRDASHKNIFEIHNAYAFDVTKYTVSLDTCKWALIFLPENE